MPVPLIVSPPLAGIPGLVHGFTTRAGGVSGAPFASLNLGTMVGDDPLSVRENYRRLSETVGVQGTFFRSVRQVHGAGVLVLRGNPPEEIAETAEGDAIVTGGAPSLLLVRVADCYPILLVDETRRAIGVCHAGWRGTLAGVLPNAIRAMRESFGVDPSDLRVAIGPGIGRERFRVSPEVAALFGETGADRVDLAGRLRRQALGEGVRTERVWSSGVCTYADRDRFYSYRRDGEASGRMVGFIGWSS